MRMVSGLVALVVIAAAAPAMAQTTACVLASGDSAAVKQYWPLPLQVVNTSDRRCTQLPFGQVSCHLSGWLYTPGGAVGKRPTIVHQHGSGQTPAEACRYIKYFLARDFVVFTPLLRGTSDSNGAFSNSGMFMDDYKTMRSNQWLAAHPGQTTVPSDVKEGFEIDYLEEEVAETRAALKYVDTLANVDEARIAITGHSFGGSQTMFASNEVLSPQPVVAVNLSGGVLSWSQDPWEARLTAAAPLHRIPILFLQTVNEGPASAPIDPMVKLFTAAQGAGKPEAVVSIFSLVEGATQGQDAHTQFFKNNDQVNRWAPVVAEFLARYGLE